MKVGTLVGSLLCLSSFAFAGADVARAERPVLMPAPVEKVFVPSGFDDNDNVEIVVHGHFPNTCFKTGPATATVDHETRVITVDAQAYRYQGAACAQIVVSFIQTVKIGTLPEGVYKIQVLGRPPIPSATLVVGVASSANPDEHLYAPVEHVALDEQENGEYAVRIEGEYPHMLIGCMVIRDVHAYMSADNTLVVLPIAELLDDGPECDAQVASKKFAFSKSIGALGPAEYLIHVRVLDGNALNRLVWLSR